ncbi:glycoside hydrolase family 16 protein [Pseudonocardia acidicola]|uniref:Glycoside hydrolase family 16 protein n=1 Tax=Pseudonocardia acidicola TaxID=2724939 RepID=A0ABX1S4U4_9PSEU|nr:glycoside hydrolase family 16 protein [Pseudonocardia acidicola]NMH95927.1 glycoside hydrolase family 16 protein [Pseudonocardia acidicola]
MLVGLQACRIAAAAVMLAMSALSTDDAGSAATGGARPPAVGCTVTPQAADCLPGTGLGGAATSDGQITGPVASAPSSEAPAPQSTSAAAGSASAGSAPTESSGPDSPANAGSAGSSSSSPPVTLTGDGGTSAAQMHGWGAPARVEEFDEGLEQWNVYDGPGHAGNGRRSPGAASVGNGYLTITGDPDGTTAGMAWNFGSMYGRWEGRIKAPASDPSYNALLLLWPDAENFPVGGEIDFMEMMDPTRQKTNAFLHYGADNSQIGGEVGIDATQWHNWAVEWTPTKITTFVDGQEWWSTTDTSAFPPGPMHMTIQLDWFPKGGAVQQSRMYVDWVRFYPVDGTGVSPLENNTTANPVGAAGVTGTPSAVPARSTTATTRTTAPPAPAATSTTTTPAAPATPTAPATSATPTAPATSATPTTRATSTRTTTTTPTTTAPPEPLADPTTSIGAASTTPEPAAPTAGAAG